MTTSPDPAALDANILVYAMHPTVPQYAASRLLVDRANVPGAKFCVFPQTLAEFFAVVTNPRRVTVPVSPTSALDAIDVLLAMPGIAPLPVPVDLVARWTQLVHRRPVVGGKVFDVQLVAAMIGSGVSKLYTYNTADFQHFPQIQVLTP